MVARNRTQVTETLSGVTRVITYTYDGLYRLNAADYSSDERYAYHYDAVGNRQTYTQTTALDETTVTTYTYDAANHLTQRRLPDASSQAYTWDDRGNLLCDGVYTYIYNSAGRMVQAKAITVTLVYTYNTDGLRVAQDVNGAIRLFVWDWANPTVSGGVPEMLCHSEMARDGDKLYLIGYDTLGWWGSNEWAFVLPDALGSVRQESNRIASARLPMRVNGHPLVASLERSRRVEVGDRQTGLGYTGEWQAAYIDLLYSITFPIQAESGLTGTRDRP